MAERTIHPWTSLCCSQCGFEGQATRTHSKRIDPEAWLCSDCELMKPLEEENARLRAEVEYQARVIDSFHQGHNVDQEELTKARAEVERLRRATAEAVAYLDADTPDVARHYLSGALAREDGAG